MSFIKIASATYLKFLGLVLIPVSALFLIFFLIYQPHEKLVEENKASVLKIEKGMTRTQVNEIMGTELLTKTKWESDSVYSYETELLSSAPISILFNEEMEVKGVIVPDGMKSPVGVDK
jgi:hypothetical protein